MDVFADLRAEYEALDAVLTALSPEQWSHPSAAEGWTVADVVLHLSQTDELAAASIAGDEEVFSAIRPGEVDARAADIVAAQRDTSPAEILARWRTAAFGIPDALAGLPPGTRLRWITNRMSAAALATTRIAEHWTHAHDITDALGIPYPDTARLRHIAWLGHRTLPYAFDAEGIEGGPVRVELTSPDGETWSFGDPDAPSRITGPAGDFCRVGARRLAPAASRLEATGPHGAQALAVLRNYAV
ncbi:maleylpyruvate isomerase family mycothiol-dependent enzyme [Actinomadura rudentiformis]|uniref:Maleylpyruvate isomerase family mycothiol-dependent enzyme n=1 Tax=Actinomadura rudentiformis TaxID=359158 RepID=A0A6H9YQQ1_9ACTN|nr:maleylpyruvate isomerase family mycothiol-dependent enzyme [Actinomadura rudentiformis]KAB2349767.1 maleylpyruvate isomerase family mycothiol-dependent enzyme [Actinomadura rudentiformis]